VKIEATAREIRELVELSELDQSAERSAAHSKLREAVARRLPRRLLDRYQGLVEAGRVPVVVALVREACSGCHLRLPTMLASSARRASALHACPHCRRLLYVPQDATEAAEESGAASPGPPARRS
jgi:predicted  nucleic acid-binding Zn-ribbon protein